MYLSHAVIHRTMLLKMDTKTHFIVQIKIQYDKIDVTQNKINIRYKTHKALIQMQYIDIWNIIIRITEQLQWNVKLTIVAAEGSYCKNSTNHK